MCPCPSTPDADVVTVATPTTTQPMAGAIVRTAVATKQWFEEFATFAPEKCSAKGNEAVTSTLAQAQLHLQLCLQLPLPPQLLHLIYLQLLFPLHHQLQHQLFLHILPWPLSFSRSFDRPPFPVPPPTPTPPHFHVVSKRISGHIENYDANGRQPNVIRIHCCPLSTCPVPSLFSLIPFSIYWKLILTLFTSNISNTFGFSSQIPQCIDAYHSFPSLSSACSVLALFATRL